MECVRVSHLIASGVWAPACGGRAPRPYGQHTKNAAPPGTAFFILRANSVRGRRRRRRWSRIGWCPGRRRIGGVGRRGRRPRRRAAIDPKLDRILIRLRHRLVEAGRRHGVVGIRQDGVDHRLIRFVGNDQFLNVDQLVVVIPANRGLGREPLAVTVAAGAVGIENLEGVLRHVGIGGRRVIGADRGDRYIVGAAGLRDERGQGERGGRAAGAEEEADFGLGHDMRVPHFGTLSPN